MQNFPLLHRHYNSVVNPASGGTLPIELSGNITLAAILLGSPQPKNNSGLFLRACQSRNSVYRSHPALQGRFTQEDHRLFTTENAEGAEKDRKKCRSAI